MYSLSDLAGRISRPNGGISYVAFQRWVCRFRRVFAEGGFARAREDLSGNYIEDQCVPGLLCLVMGFGLYVAGYYKSRMVLSRPSFRRGVRVVRITAALRNHVLFLGIFWFVFSNLVSIFGPILDRFLVLFPCFFLLFAFLVLSCAFWCFF